MAGKRKVITKVTEVVEGPEQVQARKLAEVRSAVPELPIADLSGGYKRPKEATGELRVRRQWDHAMVVIDEVGRQFKMYRPGIKPAPRVGLPKPEVPQEAPPPGEEATTPSEPSEE